MHAQPGQFAREAKAYFRRFFILTSWHEKRMIKKGGEEKKRRKKKNIYICIPEEQISRRDVLNRNDLVDTEIFRHCRSRIYRHGWSPRAIMNLFRSTLRSFARNLLVPMLIEYSWSIVRKRIPGLQNLLKTPGEADARFMHRARSFRMYSWRAAVFPLQSSVNFKKRAAAYTGNGVETRASRMASLNTKFYFIFFFPLPPSPPLTFAIDRLLLLRVDRVHVPLSVDNQIPPKLRENTAAIGLAMIVGFDRFKRYSQGGGYNVVSIGRFKISRFHKFSHSPFR